jgi:3-deoxy-manno-octulosonate cytidylyltransferase (CMP-KDO synthetase)
LRGDGRPVAIIPARRVSARLPGKPLLDLGGKPLIQHAWEAAAATGIFAEVVVATDCPEIAETARAFGAMVEMTRPDHPSGTDRVAEAASRRAPGRVVVNVQGDQPSVTAGSLEALLAALDADPEVQMATVGYPIKRAEDLLASDTVKVVCDLRGRALYFSRAPIAGRLSHDTPVLHHFGLYAFAPGFVETYSRLPRTPLEISEDLEQLRVLEHGYPIAVAQIGEPLMEINTEGDLRAARAALAGSP